MIDKLNQALADVGLSGVSAHVVNGVVTLSGALADTEHDYQTIVKVWNLAGQIDMPNEVEATP